LGLGASIRAGTSGAADPEFGSALQIEVVERIGEATTYGLRLPVVEEGGDLRWLADSRVGPGQALGVYVSAGQGDVCLVRGPVTGHAARLTHGVAGSYVDVLGADASVQLDRVFRTRAWENARDSDAVTAIVTEAGWAPDVTATNAVHRSDLRNLAQADTDLRFVRRLARRNGYLAWLTTDATSGLDTFHFKPAPLDVTPSVKLSLNQSASGTGAIELRWDSERPTAFSAEQHELGSAARLSSTETASPSRALGAQRLADLVAAPQTSRVVAPSDDSADVTARAEGAAFEAEWFVQANLETTLASARNVIRSHELIELTGLGSRHSGHWLVLGVRHTIEATGHRMQVDLVRNAWGAHGA
jgi:phage protein D